MKAVILAGGKGTRLSKLIKNTSKPLVKIGGKPIIEHQVVLLRESGIQEIWLLLGYFGDQIKGYFKNGGKWDVNIHYCQEKKPLGTAGALRQLENEIKEDFLVLSGDVMLNFDLKRFIKYHRQKRDIASIVVHPNDHPFDSDLVQVDKKWQIISLLKRPHPPGLTFHNISIASVYIFSPKIFKYIPLKIKSDIEKDIFPLILKSKAKIYAYNSPEYFKDIGTPQRLFKARKDYASGKTKELNLKRKRKAIFLDRDGVINEEVDQICKVEDLKIYNFATGAIRKINDVGYLVIIITNQPMIAKGFMTENDLNEIHKRLETELGLKGAKIDGIYYCPHHPEKGFKGEISALKVKCNCRKPRIGLIRKAVNDFNINLKNSFFIGDSSIDAKTAENAHIRFIGVKTGYSCQDGKCRIKQKFRLYKNLLEAVNNIL